MGGVTVLKVCKTTKNTQVTSVFCNSISIQFSNDNSNETIN